MPITVSGPCEIVRSRCQVPSRLDLPAMEWKYHSSMVVLSSYCAQAILPCAAGCGRAARGKQWSRLQLC